MQKAKWLSGEFLQIAVIRREVKSKGESVKALQVLLNLRLGSRTEPLDIDGSFGAKTLVGAPKSLQMVTAAMKLKDAYSLEGKL